MKIQQKGGGAHITWKQKTLSVVVGVLLKIIVKIVCILITKNKTLTYNKNAVRNTAENKRKPIQNALMKKY